MSGYTPLFGSLTTGTLCGKWPDIGLWPIVLSMADKHGVVDVTPQFISGVTGLALEDVIACMERFCGPDPGSRSNAQNGARLELLDGHRTWGWRVINHELYREKARLMAKAAREVESGKNKERMQDRRSPPVTAADPLSNANANAYSDSKSKNSTASPTPIELEVPRGTWFLDFKLAYPHRAGDQGWRKAQRAAHARMGEGHTPEDFIAGARRYAEFCSATGKLGTEYVKQAASFLGPDKPFLEPWALPATKADARLASNLSAADEFMRRTEST